MLEVEEGMGKEIREVDPFLWTSDQTSSEEVSAVATGMETQVSRTELSGG